MTTDRCRRRAVLLLPAVLLMGLAAAGLRAEEPPAWAWAKYGLAPTDNPCAIPTPWPKESWKWSWFEAFKKTDYRSWGINVIMLGDSITHGWNRLTDYPNGADVLKRYGEQYPGIHPHSLGVSGDKVEETLWLVTDGNLLGSFRPPRVFTLMIGVNSLNAGRSAAEVAGGITSIVAVLRRGYPEAKILLLGVLPCWGADAPVRAKVRDTNRLIRPLADRQTVFFLDFGDRLLGEDGNIRPELTYDGIHLTAAGYEIWAALMFPRLDDLLKTGGKGDLWTADGN